MKPKKKNIKLSVGLNAAKIKEAYKIAQLQSTYFPYPPYSEQVQIIQGISTAIHKSTHALIQSPTGTGKTLCLLIGALSSLVRDDKDGRCKIYYLTRTHSQITQVITEINKTVYNCNVNIVGSRENMCINHNFSELKGKQLDKACSDACSQQMCRYRQFTEKKMPKPMNMAQFRQFGLQNCICPYFFSRQFSERCEVTIMPFNYLLDWSLLECNHFSLKDSIIIFDEAHNIDSIAEKGASIVLSTDSVYCAVLELKNLYRTSRVKVLHTKLIDDHETINPQQIKSVINMLDNLHNHLKKEPIRQFYRKSDIVEFLQQSTQHLHQTTKLPIDGIDLTTWRIVLNNAKKIIKFFFKRHIICQHYQKVLNVLQKMYSVLQENNNQYNDYYISMIDQGKSRLLNFQCLNPSISFQKILSCKPRSMILSSGTLGPFDFWQKFLQIHFQIKLSISSYVTPHKLLARVLPQSQNHCRFDFSFANKHHDQQYCQLVTELKSIQQIVNKGIVVAFSNYQIMQKTLQRAINLQKQVYYETRNCNINDLYNNFSGCAVKEGAFLFIIMKGRFSEGINFSGDLCRCMVLVGIPFLPLNSRYVLHKKQYIQQKQSKQDAEKWYRNQGFIAVSQTIGRVIRNKDDYGIVVLADQRFHRVDIQNELPLWFTNCIRHSSKASLQDQIQSFLSTQPWLEEITTTTNKKQISITNNKQGLLTKRDLKVHKNITLEKLVEFSTPAKSNKKRLLISEIEQVTNTQEPKKCQIPLPRIVKAQEISYFLNQPTDILNDNSSQQDITSKIKVLSKHIKNKRLNFDKFDIDF